MIVQYADLKRPVEGSGLLGEAASGSTTVASNVPLLRMRLLAGREQMAAQQLGIDAQYAVEVHVDPSWTDLKRCWLELVGSGRRLNIIYVDDTRPPRYTLFCGEVQ